MPTLGHAKLIIHHYNIIIIIIRILLENIRSSRMNRVNFLIQKQIANYLNKH